MNDKVLIGIVSGVSALCIGLSATSLIVSLRTKKKSKIHADIIDDSIDDLNNLTILAGKISKEITRLSDEVPLVHGLADKNTTVLKKKFRKEYL